MKSIFYLLLPLLLFGCATEEELSPSFPNTYYLNPDLTYDSIADCSGNTYATIEIGNQEWMAENLRTTCYANGDLIPNVTDANQWDNLTTGAWAHFQNDSQYENPFGKLYNWYAVTEPRNVCPTGWHVPTDAEWSLLRNYLGGESVDGGKMKTSGTQYWQAPNTGATNESGFSGLPGGTRIKQGPWDSFSSIGSNGHWWSATETSANWALGRTLLYHSVRSSGWNTEKPNGLCVRCLKD